MARLEFRGREPVRAAEPPREPCAEEDEPARFDRERDRDRQPGTGRRCRRGRGRGRRGREGGGFGTEERFEAGERGAAEPAEPGQQESESIDTFSLLADEEPEPAARFEDVMGEGEQSRMSKKIGWKTTNKIIEERMARIREKLEAGAKKGMRKAGFKD